MSFWQQSPGPSWSDFFLSCWPFGKTIRPHVIDTNILQRKRVIECPSGLFSDTLTAENSEEISQFLQEHYKMFPKAKITLPASRIRNGFMFDGWLACGLRTKDRTLVGCAISRSLGTIQIAYEVFPETGLVDFFCVASDWRKKGLASYLLQELTYITANKGRDIHLFMKEGFPLSPLPPIWQSSYIVRRRELPDEKKEFLAPMDIMLRSKIGSFIHSDFIPQLQTISNKPNYLSGDSQIYMYHEARWIVYVCITDTFHRSVPEGWRLGEVLWVLPREKDTPKEVMQNAVETLVDNCRFELILMDTAWPHNSKRAWKKDAMYGWYLFNCNPTTFFGLKPYFVF